jgi:hypothetical protein
LISLVLLGWIAVEHCHWLAICKFAYAWPKLTDGEHCDALGAVGVQRLDDCACDCLSMVTCWLIILSIRINNLFFFFNFYTFYFIHFLFFWIFIKKSCAMNTRVFSLILSTPNSTSKIFCASGWRSGQILTLLGLGFW